MNQIPRCDWLPEGASPLGIARFVPEITFAEVQVGTRKLLLFSVTVKRSSVISLSGWNEKAETRHLFYIKLASFSVLEHKQLSSKIIFSSVLYAI